MTKPMHLFGLLSQEEQAALSDRDRMLPTQPVIRRLFSGDDEAFLSSLDDVVCSALPHSRVEHAWDLELKPGLAYASFGSSLFSLYFLRFLTRMSGAREVLELGTFIGASTLFLADAVGASGRVTTVERGEEFFEIAQRNFAKNGMSHRISPVHADVVEFVHSIGGTGRYFDMILLDAAKESYGGLFWPLLMCLSPGGFLFVDDVFMNGDALNAHPETDKGAGVRSLLTQASALGHEFDRVLLPVGNGVLLVRSPR